MCGFTLKERKKSAELREQLGLDLVSLVIKKSRLRWFGRMPKIYHSMKSFKCKNDADGIKCCTQM